MKYIIFLSLFFSSVIFAQCPGYKEPTIKNKQVHELCYSHFMIMYNDITKTPVYGAEILTDKDVTASEKINRHDSFHSESKLPSNIRALPSDYSNSGFDKGHIIPAGDQPDMNSQAESFSMANMMPQDPMNNRNTWRGLESKTRDIALSSGYVYMISGPIYTDTNKTIKNGIAIPQKMFKVLFDKNHKYVKGWILDNNASSVPNEVSQSELETITNIKF